VSKRVTADFSSLKRAVKTKIGSLKETKARAVDPAEVQSAIDALDGALASLSLACASMRREFLVYSDAEMQARKTAPSRVRTTRKIRKR
jgi:hypothetical protein